MDTFEFDADAYRRIRLPWLMLVFILSFAVDIILLRIWQSGVNPNAQFYWNVGFAFLGIINLIFMKGFALKRYLQTKKLRTRSYVCLKENQVVHYVLLSRMTHWQVETVKETKFSADGKNEYISAETYYIRHVKNLKRSSNGSITIDGFIEREILNEGWEEYSSEFGKVFKKSFKRHTIPGYYENMEEIFHALNKLK